MRSNHVIAARSLTCHCDPERSEGEAISIRVLGINSAISRLLQDFVLRNDTVNT